VRRQRVTLELGQVLGEVLADGLRIDAPIGDHDNPGDAARRSTFSTVAVSRGFFKRRSALTPRPATTRNCRVWSHPKRTFLLLLAAPDSQLESMLGDGNQEQIKHFGFNRIWDPYSIGTEKAQNTLQVAENKGWLPGMDSNHDSRKPFGMCNLQILKRPRLPKWTRNTPIGTASVQSSEHQRRIEVDKILGDNV
jgi:hypothetical protein